MVVEKSKDIRSRLCADAKLVCHLGQITTAFLNPDLLIYHSRLNNAPFSNMFTLEAVNVIFYGKREFVGVINYLDMDNHSGLSR